MGSNNKVAIKSGLWYVIGDILFRTIGFLTTPIFTRILSVAEFGQFNNILSWSVILFFIVSIDLHSSLVRSKLDYEDDMERYATSILLLSTVVNIILYAIVKLNIGFFSELFSIQPKYIDIMFIYMLFLEAYYVFITYERANYRYKRYTIATGIVILSVNIVSIALVFILQDKLNARVYGYFIPYIIIGAVMYFMIVKRKPKIKIEYIKYALALSLPLLPHLISLNILSSSDKVMITSMIGEEANAIYSIAYLIANILVIIYVAMNKAWAPWFMDTLKAGNKAIIRTASKFYFLAFVAIIFGVGLISPEVILILGGQKYLEATTVLVPLLISTIFQFGYSMYLQVEVYEKKLKVVSFATIVAALTNIGLNLILLKRFGYIAAGYTTLIGYAVCYLIHYNTISKMGYKHLLDTKTINIALLGSLLVLPIFTVLYNYTVIRYIILIVYAAAFIFVVLKNYKKVLAMWRKK